MNLMVLLFCLYLGNVRLCDVLPNEFETPNWIDVMSSQYLHIEFWLVFFIASLTFLVHFLYIFFYRVDQKQDARCVSVGFDVTFHFHTA